MEDSTHTLPTITSGSNDTNTDTESTEEDADLYQPSTLPDVSSMAEVTEHAAERPKIGQTIEGKVVAIDKTGVYLDTPPYGTGIIYGREYLNARSLIRKMHIGDEVSGKVVDLNHPEGYVEISLREARQAIIWSEAEEHRKNKDVLEVEVADANKGGLIMNWQGLQGFLPASQLSPENYPRVEDGDKDKILTELRRLQGEKLKVTIITASPQEGKLIFSEKDPQKQNKEQIIDKYSLGDVVRGTVTGVVEFGLFLRIEDGLEGLVHISEIDWALVEDPKKLYNIGDTVDAKVIEIKDDKISLSIKALKENPWNDAAKRYSKGDTVEGVVIKFNRHGALASIEEGVAGLVHISEFNDEAEMYDRLKLGNSYKYKILLFDPKEQKMTLSLED